jgi:hypothetical protein
VLIRGCLEIGLAQRVEAVLQPEVAARPVAKSSSPAARATDRFTTVSAASASDISAGAATASDPGCGWPLAAGDHRGDEKQLSA